MKTSTALLSVLLLAVFLSAAAAYTLKTSDVPVTSLDLSTISGATLLDGATLFQDSRPIPQNLSTGSFSFKFYNSTITKISLHPNGVLYFNPTAEELSPFNKPGAILGSGAGSTCPYPSNLTKFEQGFSFCLPSGYDYTWEAAPSVVYYHTFEAGACPFTPKASEACLVVQYFDAGTSDGATGNITAIVFSSGDFFSQVSTPAGAAWFGYQFGIQDLQANQGVTFPSSEFCSATATILAPGDPWNFGIPSLDLTPGTTFNFFIAADCESGQVARDDGLGCTTPPSHSAGSSLSAAWIDSALLL